jgi:hypothetical protein
VTKFEVKSWNIFGDAEEYYETVPQANIQTEI